MKKSNHVSLGFIPGTLFATAIGDDSVSLNVQYDNVDQVPEAFRPLYSEKDGKAVLTGVVGLKTQDDINRLQGALQKERDDHKAVRGTLSRLGDRSIDDVLEQLDRIPALEAAAKGADNIDEQIAGRLQQEVAPLQRKISGYETELETLRGQVTEYAQREVARDINDVVGSFASKMKVLPEAVDDIQFLARSIFEKNEAGEVVAKAGIPNVTPGISPEVWLTELKQNKPYYWPASNLPNMRSGGSKGGNNPWNKESWNMTEQGRLFRENPTLAKQLAAQAGMKL